MSKNNFSELSDLVQGAIAKLKEVTPTIDREAVDKVVTEFKEGLEKLKEEGRAINEAKAAEATKEAETTEEDVTSQVADDDAEVDFIKKALEEVFADIPGVEDVKVIPLKGNVKAEITRKEDEGDEEACECGNHDHDKKPFMTIKVNGARVLKDGKEEGDEGADIVVLSGRKVISVYVEDIEDILANL